MSKKTRKAALKLREFVQSGAGDFWLADEDIDHIVQSGTEECWLAQEEEDIDEEAPRQTKRRKLRNAMATASHCAAESPTRTKEHEA